jgi:hypothetical protein
MRGNHSWYTPLEWINSRNMETSVGATIELVKKA